MKTVLSLIALAIAVASLTGCGSGNDMTKEEMDRAKGAKFDDAARAKVAAGMAAGAEAAKRQEADWAAKHPDELAKVNAERAKAGRPPLGAH